MSYATIADVQRLNPVRPIGTSTVPSLNDVTGFLADTGAELDGVLAALEYPVPVPASASQSFRLVQRLNALGAYALSEQAAPDSPYAKSAAVAWADAIERLQEGKLKLPDLGHDAAAAQISVRSAATPFFTRDIEF